MIEDYFEDIILFLNENPYIDSFEIIKKKVTSTDGYIRLRAKVINNDLLEISIYCQKKKASIEVIDYRYHWQNEEGVLKRRWDNCPHHKDIENFPFHVHLNDNTVKPSEKVDIYKVLELIEKDIKGISFYL
jgi:hypothetical protein